MASSVELNCTLLVRVGDKQTLPTAQELISELENTDPLRKCAALKKTIMLVLAGEEMPRVLFTVIRYCITVENHTLQKLLMLFYEVVRKYDAQGKLLPEMILVTCVAGATRPLALFFFNRATPRPCRPCRSRAVPRRGAAARGRHHGGRLPSPSPSLPCDLSRAPFPAFPLQ